MAGIKDVALAAGVSVATVSRALNGVPSVAPEFVDRVMRAVTETGYRPNAIARSLRTQSTKTIALIISDVSNPFFTAVARGVEDVAQQHGFSVLLCNADEDASKEESYLHLAEQARVAGIVISPHSESTDVSRFAQNGTGVVMIDRPTVFGCDGVFVRSFEAARHATQHLIDEGWESLVCITGPRNVATAHLRAEGFSAAIRERGGEARVVYSDFREAGGREAVARLFDGAAPPGGLLIGNASMALGILGELSDRSLRPGRDVGIVSFDDAPWAPYVRPSISVVAQPAYEMGVRAARLLFEPGSRHPREVFLDAELIVRRSSRRPHATSSS